MGQSGALNPDVSDVWRVTRLVRLVSGFMLGLLLYTYNVFLYDKFGGSTNPLALKLTVAVIIIQEFFILICEVPTGAVADYIGRKKAVVVSFAFGALSCFLGAWIPFLSSVKSVFLFAVATDICYAFCFTFMSGTFIAWIVDTLRVRGIPEGHGPMLARAFSITFGGQIVGAAIGLTLYLGGYFFYVQALGCILYTVAAFYCWVMMVETESMNFYEGKLSFRPAVKRMRVIIITGTKIILQTPALLYLILAYSCFMLLNGVVNCLWPVAMKVNYGAGKMSSFWFAIVYLVLAVAYSGSKVAAWVSRKFSTLEKREANPRFWFCYFGVSIIAATGILVLGFSDLSGRVPIVLFLVAIPLFRFSYGFLSPVFNTLLNNYIPPDHSQERATIMSLESMFGSLLTIFLMFPSSGPNADEIAVGWMIPSGILFITMLVLHFFMRRYQRKIGELPGRATSPVVESASS